MLMEESVWIGNELLNLAKQGELSPLLNFGSSTGHFRRYGQPVIYNNIFRPLQSIEAEVYHLDIKKAEGVDFVGNVFEDKELYNEIKKKGIKTILCSNLLEHVPDRIPFFRILENLLGDHGYLLITVPNLYPYHADPIDTGYRPSVPELVKEFPAAKVIKSEVITVDESHFTFMIKRPKLFLIVLIRLITPFYKFKAWKRNISDLPNWFKKFKVTCVLFELKN